MAATSPCSSSEERVILFDLCTISTVVNYLIKETMTIALSVDLREQVLRYCILCH